MLLAVALATLESTLANTALPVIAAGLGASPARAVWIVNAYQLAVVSSLLPFAALGEHIGPRRIFLGGLVCFTVASLACALSQTLPQLAAARLLQGIGGGALMSVNIALIRALFPPQHLGRGVGLNAMVVGCAFAAGPSLAALLLSFGSWHVLFAVNLPLGLLALLFAWPALPRGRGPAAHFDAPAAALCALCFAGLILTLVLAGQRQPVAWVLAAAAAMLGFGGWLLRRQAGQRAPMLPLDLLRRPLFALSTITAFGAFAAQGLAFVALPFYLQGPLQRDAVATGWLMTPWPVVVALAAPVAGRLSERWAPGAMGGTGLAVLAASLAALALLPAQPSDAAIMGRMLLCGLGFGLFQSPNLKALMSSAPAERSGAASGMIALVRLTGQASGAALVALCFGLGGAAGAVQALWLGCGFAALACAASWARLWAR